MQKVDADIEIKKTDLEESRVTLELSLTFTVTLAIAALAVRDSWIISVILGGFSLYFARAAWKAREEYKKHHSELKRTLQKIARM